MSDANPLPTESRAAARQRDRVRVRTLVLIRWMAVVGQAMALVIVAVAFGADLPLLWAGGVVALSAALNLWITLRRRLRGWHSDREAVALLAYDIVQLAVLLYLTGGLANPFAILLLVPVTISATILSLRSTIFLGLLAFCAISVLTVAFLPLPLPEATIQLPPVYLFGIWSALNLGMTFLMFYAWRVAQEARGMSTALVETQLALAREQQMASLGGLAAAAAHELGTPLGTIGLVAKELAHDLPADSAWREDIELLHSQAERCRTILARLSRNPTDDDPAVAHMTLSAVVRSVLDRLEPARTNVHLERRALNQADEPVVQRRAELVEGLANLINNATEFAEVKAQISVVWSDETIWMSIEDDGPGFASAVLAALGEPYVSTRAGRGGMGLGVFISKTLLERTGATLAFSNRSRLGGARVMIEWPRTVLDSSVALDASAMGTTE